MHTTMYSNVSTYLGSKAGGSGIQTSLDYTVEILVSITTKAVTGKEGEKTYIPISAALTSRPFKESYLMGSECGPFPGSHPHGTGNDG